MAQLCVYVEDPGSGICCTRGVRNFRVCVWTSGVEIDELFSEAQAPSLAI